MNVSELVTAAAEACGATSDRDLARQINVSHTIIGQWRSGDRYPTFEAAARLAELANLPINATAAAIRLQSPEGQKYRSVLRKIGAAAAICLAVYTAIPNAHAKPGSIGHKADVLYITYIQFHAIALKSLSSQRRL